MNKSNLKPIETKYKGYKFRSRLEARWAVFFEGMGLDWTYEPEGFQLPSNTWYLPDFFVKGHITGENYYYEIKPRGSKPCLKVKEFNDYKNIVQLNGDPFDYVKFLCPRCGVIESDFVNADYIPQNGDMYYCFYCDHSKPRHHVSSIFKEDTINYLEIKTTISWHKGTIILPNNTSLFIKQIEFWKLKARQERFDGNDDIS